MNIRRRALIAALQPRGATASVTGLGNQSPTSQVYTRDPDFPTSFEDVTFGGDVFVKIPTMYRKVLDVTDGQITAFEMATAKLDNSYEPYPVFVAPDNSILPYVLLGKYLSKSTTAMNSVADGSPASLTIGKARTFATARGTGYQQYDVHFQKLFVDLCLLVSQKVDFNSGQIISNYLGVDNLDVYFWVDGIATTMSGYWAVANNPANYINHPDISTTGYTRLSYRVPSGSDGFIKKLGYDPNNGFINYPSDITGTSSYQYYCDKMVKETGASSPVSCSIGYANAVRGLWYTDTYADWSMNSKSARLCYRPVS